MVAASSVHYETEEEDAVFVENAQKTVQVRGWVESAVPRVPPWFGTSLGAGWESRLKRVLYVTTAHPHTPKKARPEG